MALRRSLLTGATAVVTAASLAACNAYDDNPEAADNAAEGESSGPIRIGTTDGQKQAWRVFEDKAQEAGIELSTQEFADYNTPNDALAQGALDVNLFQHLQFLSVYNAGADQDLTPVGSTEVIPLALYWKGHDSLEGIEGQSVAIPNDRTNLARGINVLKQAGLLTLTRDDLREPSEAEIDEEKSKVTITPVDAAQTTAAWGEGKPAIINNSFLDRAGIDPDTAVAKDDPEAPEAEPYINVFVTNADKKDDERIAELVKIWHSPEVQAAVDEDSKGTSVAVDRPKEELQEILDDLVKEQKELKE